MALLRLDKILSETGKYSRGEAAALIKKGLVTVDGAIASSGAVKYDPEQVGITACGEVVVYKKYVYIMLNKPSGVVTATEDNMHETVVDLLDDELKRRGVFPVGRLDKDTVGLLLLTNNGNFGHAVIAPSSGVYKRYRVRSDLGFTRGDVVSFDEGIVLNDGTRCLQSRLEISADDEFEAHIEIAEGKYHQIKRMLAAVGKKVTYLKRVAIGGLLLDEFLAHGEYRELTDAEVSVIFDKTVERDIQKDYKK